MMESDGPEETPGMPGLDPMSQVRALAETSVQIVGLVADESLFVAEGLEVPW